jgi:tetratricopeptide (TPR) repeat protein
MTTWVSACALAGFFTGTAAAAAAHDTEWAGKLSLAEQAQTSGRYPEAVALLRQAAALADGFGPRDRRTWSTYNSLAVAYENAGLLSDSMRTYRQAMAMVKAAVGTETADYAWLEANLGVVHLRHGDTAPAVSTLREALQIEMRLPQPKPDEIAFVQSRMAEPLVSLHRYEEAERMIGLALPVLERAERTVDVAIAFNDLGLVRRRQRRYDESLAEIGKAVATLEAKFGSVHPLLLNPLINQAVVYSLAGRNEEAGATFRRALTICTTSLPPDHPSHAALLARYARFLRGIGEKTQAKAVEAEARSLAQDNARREGMGITVDVSGLRH